MSMPIILCLFMSMSISILQTGSYHYISPYSQHHPSLITTYIYILTMPFIYDILSMTYASMAYV